MPPRVQIKNLEISFTQGKEIFEAVKNISFEITQGKITALTGESGSGKSLTALSFMQLLPENAKTNGEIIFYDGAAEQDVLSLSFKEIKKLRGNRIAMIFQEPMTSLNPVKTCGAQVMESLQAHCKISKAAAKKKVISLFEKVDLPEPAVVMKKYPHQISGGQKQRVMIAMAMSGDPALLIADEPTTALDVRVQKNILELLKKLHTETGMSMLLITHDLAVVADYADEIIVMNKGEIVEQGKTVEVLLHPKEDYTKKLLNARNEIGKRPVTDDRPSSVFNEEMPLLQVKNLLVRFSKQKNFFGKTISFHEAVNDINFSIYKNETVGLVGESGCGKTTLGRAVLGLIKPAGGEIIFHGENIIGYSAEQMRILRKEMQIVFQDPYGSLNPRMTIGDAIMEPMQVHFPGRGKNARRVKAAELLDQVKLSPDLMKRYPHQFSGGQRQRICIARALAVDPGFLVFDESVSALDVTVQAQVLNLISDLKANHSFTSLFISHDLSVISHISDRVIVMQSGKIVETGSPEQIFNSPQENYTKELLASVPGRNLVK